MFEQVFSECGGEIFLREQVLELLLTDIQQICAVGHEVAVRYWGYKCGLNEVFGLVVGG